ncbi:MAG TPA: peptidylprolyl isomerase [Spirochaetia bacterium]|nr:peptidylprolyl isomerase [Spirochaetia bacterium]
MSDYRVQIDTSRGPVVLQVHADWAPLGAGRFRELIEAGYYSDVAFFRVLPGFVAQFGISGDPQRGGEWREQRIKDDPTKAPNTRGTVTFAMAGPNTRTTQLFINYGDNSRLDSMGFAPFAEVVEGMENIDSLYGGYGEGAPNGNGPDQGRIHGEGNAYLRDKFPKLDYIVSTALVEE